MAIATFLVVFFAYAYFVSVSVADVVMRKEVDEQIATLGTTISQLEADYIEMQHSVNHETAAAEGFVLVSSKTFIDTAQGTTLVLHTN